MENMVPRGTGNSRMMKSNIPASTTLSQLIQMLNNGTFPYDIGPLNQAGIAQKGDPLNKNTLLKDATAEMYGLDRTAVPDDVLRVLPNKLGPQVGDTLTTVRTNLGDKWLLCNGDEINRADYPEYSKLKPLIPKGAEEYNDTLDKSYNYPKIYKTIIVDGRYVSVLINFTAATNGKHQYYLLYSDSLSINSNWSSKLLWEATPTNNSDRVYANVDIAYGNGYIVVAGIRFNAGEDTIVVAYSTSITGEFTVKEIIRASEGRDLKLGRLKLLNDSMIHNADHFVICGGVEESNIEEVPFIAYCTTPDGEWQINRDLCPLPPGISKGLDKRVTDIIYQPGKTLLENGKYIALLYWGDNGHLSVVEMESLGEHSIDTWPVISENMGTNTNRNPQLIYADNMYVVALHQQGRSSSTALAEILITAENPSGPWVRYDIESGYSTASTISCYYVTYLNDQWIMCCSRSYDGNYYGHLVYAKTISENDENWGFNQVSAFSRKATDSRINHIFFDDETQKYILSGYYGSRKAQISNVDTTKINLPLIPAVDSTTKTYVKVKE